MEKKGRHEARFSAASALLALVFRYTHYMVLIVVHLKSEGCAGRSRKVDVSHFDLFCLPLPRSACAVTMLCCAWPGFYMFCILL